MSYSYMPNKILLRSSLLAATRVGPSHTFTKLYRPIITHRLFTMSETKKGVHNLMCKEDWESALNEKGSLLVLDCFATWCGPCKVIAPQVVKFSDKFTNARFYKLDVDDVPDVAQELGIRAMPTFLLFKDGEKVAEVVGANPKALEAAIEKNYK
ncbi:Thioredoxin amt13 [Venturia effusa]|uniref:Thioredoxin amt13 n=1 Tax=Venturia effusa TaxID=50376 RepID=A0A517LD20_9PEZI|nr:Thioredoxin amt13 [Venturia effusa]